jgi:ADP-ribose pyrophosphatase
MSDKLKEELLSSRTEFRGRLLTLRVDTIRMPSGRISEREIVEHPGAVAIVPLLEDGRVLLIRQYRHAAGTVLWELPAGVLEPQEPPEACARRELVEETGYAAGLLEPLVSIYLSPGFSTECIHLFLGRDLRAVQQSKQEDEQIEVHPLPFEEALELVRRGEIHNAAACCGLLAAQDRLFRK